MLTDAQIERAAREYCRMAGMDPDIEVLVGCMRLWEAKAILIKEHCLRQRAVEIATEEPRP